MPATTAAARSTLSVEERHLRYAAERRDDDRAWLVDRYQGLARSLALRAAGPYDEVDDLVQVALLGLVGALDRFDPTRGIAFSTFAWATISGELKRHHRDHSWDVRVPRAVQESYLRVAAATDELTSELGRAPTINELCLRTGDDESLVIQALEARHARTARSIDVPLHPDSDATIDLPTHDSEPDAIDDRDYLRSLVRRLPEREQAVISHRFFDRWTQAEIAEAVGCSQMHVSRLLSHALERLRQMAEREAILMARP